MGGDGGPKLLRMNVCSQKLLKITESTRGWIPFLASFILHQSKGFLGVALNIMLENKQGLIECTFNFCSCSKQHASL